MHRQRIPIRVHAITILRVHVKRTIVHTFTLLPHGDGVHMVVRRQCGVWWQRVFGADFEDESCLENCAQDVLFFMLEPLGFAELVDGDGGSEARLLGREQSLGLTPKTRQEPLHRRRRCEALLRRLDLLEATAGHEPRFH